MNKKQAIVAIGDIHGYQYEHVSLLRKIRQQYDIAQLIYLGDLIDRGPWVRWVLRDVRDKIVSGQNVVVLKGNHEDELLSWCNFETEAEKPTSHEIMSARFWLRNGGNATVKSFFKERYTHQELKDVLRAYKPLWDAMKYYHVQEIAGKTFVFSHSGGDPHTIDRILDGTELVDFDFEDLMYSRDRYIHGPGTDRDNVFVVYGHTPTYYAADNDGMKPLVIWNDAHISADIDIDTGCYTGKALSALIIDAETGEFETVSFPYTEPPTEKEMNSEEYSDYHDWWIDECLISANEQMKKGATNGKETLSQKLMRELAEEAEKGEAEKGGQNEDE